MSKLISVKSRSTRAARFPRQTVTIAVVADSKVVAQQISQALQHCGCRAHPISSHDLNLGNWTQQFHPEVVMVRTARESAPATAFRLMAERGGPPLVLLTPSASPQALAFASESGALVHLIEPITTQSLVAAVWLATARGRDLRQLSDEVMRLRESVRTRTAVERAKKILIQRLGLTEEQAHRRLQQESRNHNRKLAETAWHVIEAETRLRAERRKSLSISSNPT